MKHYNYDMQRKNFISTGGAVINDCVFTTGFS